MSGEGRIDVGARNSASGPRDEPVGEIIHGDVGRVDRDARCFRSAGIVNCSGVKFESAACRCSHRRVGSDIDGDAGFQAGAEAVGVVWLVVVPVQVTVVLSAGVAGEQPSASVRSLAAKGAISASAMAYRSIK